MLRARRAVPGSALKFGSSPRATLIFSEALA